MSAAYTRVAIERRVEKCTECRHALLAARYLPVEHIEERREENNHGCGAEFPHRKKYRCPAVYQQAEKCEQIWVDAGGRDRIHNLFQQPAATFANFSCEHIYVRCSALPVIDRCATTDAQQLTNDTLP